MKSAVEMAPDTEAAKVFFDQCAKSEASHVILISSAMVYGASHNNPGLMSESRPAQRNGANPVGAGWAEIESLAASALSGKKLTILRTAAVVARGGADYFSQLLEGRVAVTLAGYDPPLQLLSPEDLARAVCCAIERSEGGVFNVAPRGVIPLKKALRLAGARRAAFPRTIQKAARALLRPLGLARSIDHLDFIRYSWTVSDRRIRTELGYEPKQTSAEAALEIGGKREPLEFGIRNSEFGMGEDSLSRTPHFAFRIREARFDEFGLDPEYLSKIGRRVFNFLEKRYWRIEVDGLENLPATGGAVLVGVHRGFMPWDGIMFIHQVFQQTGRVPRFLMHPGLVKPPFAFNFMTKIGGVIACQENADFALSRGEMLGVFPEGVGGAFTLYRDAYRIGKFLRNDFVKMALRHRAPIVPFITVGSAEIFPILKKLDWRWWKKKMDWPCLPITPTFPFLPVPLPSKWHTQILAPIQIEQYGEDASDDPRAVRAISDQVRSRMAEAMQSIVRRRKSIFYGSVFEKEA